MASSGGGEGTGPVASVGWCPGGTASGAGTRSGDSVIQAWIEGASPSPPERFLLFLLCMQCVQGLGLGLQLCPLQVNTVCVRLPQTGRLRWIHYPASIFDPTPCASHVSLCP